MTNNNGKSKPHPKPNVEAKWKELESDFMKSDMTITEFAEVKELPLSTVHKWSTRLNWRKRRDVLKRENLLAGKTSFDKACAKTLMQGLETIGKAMEFEPSARAIPPLMKCVRDIQEGMYRLMDVPLPKQRHEEVPPDETPMDKFKSKVREEVDALDPNDLNVEFTSVNDDSGGSENGN